jgi:hypothetical protein
MPRSGQDRILGFHKRSECREKQSQAMKEESTDPALARPHAANQPPPLLSNTPSDCFSVLPRSAGANSLHGPEGGFHNAKDLSAER